MTGPGLSGRSGLRARLREHIRLAQTFAAWVDGDPDWERLAPVRFSTVCFRLRPRGWSADDARLTPLNQRLLEAVNATGEVSLSHTVLPAAAPLAPGGPGAMDPRPPRYALRLAVGRILTEERHVATAWEILRAEALRLGATPPVVARRGGDASTGTPAGGRTS
jgi:aromatic-L-amino-acid/L-tryptophan decarboxylase